MNKTQSKLYVLRLWRESADQSWRLTIKRSGAHTATYGLPSIESLVEFLNAEIYHMPADDAETP